MTISHNNQLLQCCQGDKTRGSVSGPAPTHTQRMEYVAGGHRGQEPDVGGRVESIVQLPQKMAKGPAERVSPGSVSPQPREP